MLPESYVTSVQCSLKLCTCMLCGVIQYDSNCICNVSLYCIHGTGKLRTTVFTIRTYIHYSVWTTVVVRYGDIDNYNNASLRLWLPTTLACDFIFFGGGNESSSSHEQFQNVSKMPSPIKDLFRLSSMNY